MIVVVGLVHSKCCYVVLVISQIIFVLSGMVYEIKILSRKREKWGVGWCFDGRIH